MSCKNCFYFHLSPYIESEEFQKGYCSQQSSYIESPEWKDECEDYTDNDEVNERYNQATKMAVESMRLDGIPEDIIQDYEIKRSRVPERS